MTSTAVPGPRDQMPIAVLTKTHHKKYAVVTKECGELGIDNDLLIDADEEVSEMHDGRTRRTAREACVA